LVTGAYSKRAGPGSSKPSQQHRRPMLLQVVNSVALFAYIIVYEHQLSVAEVVLLPGLHAQGFLHGKLVDMTRNLRVPLLPHEVEIIYHGVFVTWEEKLVS
jgi:hypothetical protein